MTTEAKYVLKDGQMVKEEQGWSLAMIPNFFWGTLNTVGLFFQTFVAPETTVPQRNNNFSRTANPYANGGPRPPGAPRPNRQIHGMANLPACPPSKHLLTFPGV